jgi:predicted nucleotidyltransferase
MRDAPGETSRRPPLAEEDRDAVLTRLTHVLAGEEDVVFAYAFGSFVEGGPFEDLDVALFLDDGCMDVLTRQLDLTARLEAAASLPVDIVLLNDAPLGLRGVALRGRLLYSRDEGAGSPSSSAQVWRPGTRHSWRGSR